jgi:hypothetical protein
MTSEKKNAGRISPFHLSANDDAKSLLNATVAPSADTSLSAAFRHVLGNSQTESPFVKAGASPFEDFARRAKADRPGKPSSGAPRKNHIGPRSGHK